MNLATRLFTGVLLLVGALLLTQFWQTRARVVDGAKRVDVFPTAHERDGLTAQRENDLVVVSDVRVHPYPNERAQDADFLALAAAPSTSNDWREARWVAGDTASQVEKAVRTFLESRGRGDQFARLHYGLDAGREILAICHVLLAERGGVVARKLAVNLSRDPGREDLEVRSVAFVAHAPTP